MRGCKPTYNWWRPPTHSEIVMIHGKSRGQTNHTFGWDRGEPSWFVKQINFFPLVVSADFLTDFYPWKPEHYWGFTHSLVPSSAHAKRHTHTYIYIWFVIVCISETGRKLACFPSWSFSCRVLPMFAVLVMNSFCWSHFLMYWWVILPVCSGYASYISHFMHF
jgi:hypothetical protein